MAGKMKNCSNCGKVFVSINNSRICMDCRAKEEEYEKKIIAYVRDNPKSTIAQIVEETGAQEPLIRRMIREGRFVATGVELYYPCDKCGSPIQRGQYCEKCQKEMREELTAAIAKKSGAVAKPAADATSGRRGYVTLGDKMGK